MPAVGWTKALKEAREYASACKQTPATLRDAFCKVDPDEDNASVDFSTVQALSKWLKSRPEADRPGASHASHCLLLLTVDLAAVYIHELLKGSCLVFPVVEPPPRVRSPVPMMK